MKPSTVSPLLPPPPRLDFEALFGASPNPYMVLDRELRYVAANAAYLQVSASRLEELLGRNVFDAFPNDPADPGNAPARLLRESFERVLRERKPDVLALIPYRVPQHTPTGVVVEERYWSATHTPLLDGRGEVAFILQHTVDVTELQRLKQSAARGTAPSLLMEAGVLSRAQVVQEAHRLVEAERRHLLGLFEQAPGFVCFLRGPEHVFELANGAYLELTGRYDLLGKPLRQALPEVEGQGFVALLDRVFSSGEPFVGRDMRVVLQRGGAAPEERYVDFVYQPIRGADGQVSGILVQGQDNTERKAATAERERTLRELSEAVRLRDEFLSVASHELKTPLTPLALRLEQLERALLTQPADGSSRERELRSLEVAQRQVKKLAALVEDLLDTSRLGEGRLRMEPRPVDLAALVRDVAQRLEPELRRAGCRLELSVPRALVGQWDPERLEQVLASLLSNALKYGPGLPVALRVEARASHAWLVVQDHGIGIQPEVLPHIFGKYERGVSERHYGGLGLGLYLTHQLVEAMGGSVRAESVPGHGATFTVQLPLQAPAAAAGSAAPGGAEELASQTEFEQQLVGIVSHDLRNPLAAIHMVAANLLRREDLDERSTRGLARIQSSTERALRLVRDLLDFTQARLGQGILLQPGPVDLHALVRQGLVDVQSAFPERELRHECEGDAQGEWDADRLTQVLVNLTTNALAFSPAATPVTVRTWGEGTRVGLSVHNGGAPIPPQLLPRLFEPLQRGTREAERGSVGLGLFIVRHLVHAHGGSVEVQSSEAGGTRFTVHLPRRVPGQV